MQYRKFRDGVMLSALGYGCMRYPSREDKSVIEDEAISLLRRAADAGINYFDTAYVYHGGNSEVVLGKALADRREKVYIADKMPLWGIKAPEDFDRLFKEQLERLGTDYIDFYLLHSLNKQSFEEKVLAFGLLDKMRDLKASGKVKYIGFSFHDSNEVFHTILDAFHDCDFVQIQYNYIDTENQAGTEGLEYAASKGKAVMIMEPLLGGKLANLNEAAASALPEGANPVKAALDFLWSRPEVTTVLSGMSNAQQLEDNLTYAGDSAVGKMSDDELASLGRVRSIFLGTSLVPCTGCAYCIPCPAGIEIPDVFRIYNKTAPALGLDPRAEYEALEIKPDECLSCGACEDACPQHIAIRERLADTVKAFTKAEDAAE